MSKLRELILLLLAGDGLPEMYKDHPLRGNWKGYRDEVRPVGRDRRWRVT
jgi:mRNA interferase YafQ